MKKLTLQSLALTNFKGQTFTLETQGKNANIYGQNATGKTSLKNAYDWLFSITSKISFDIKNIKLDGSHEHKLEHAVQGDFTNTNGTPFTLKKAYKETWAKKRKNPMPELTGHTTAYFFNDMELAISPKEYQERLESFSTLEAFRILSDPFYLAEEMAWKPRRDLLVSFAGGDISDEDLLKKNKNLAPLLPIIKIRTVDNHRLVLADQKSALNKELTAIDIKITENAHGAPDISDIILIEEQDRVKELSVDLEAIEAKTSTLKNTGALAELQNDLANTETELITATNVITEKYNADRSVTQAKVRALKDKIADLEAKSLNNKAEIGRLNNDKAFVEKVLLGLRSEWDALKKKDADFKSSIIKGQCTCGSCGDVHDLPAEKVEAMTALHNESLSKEKASNVASGMAKKKQMDDIAAKIVTIASGNELIEKDRSPIAGELQRLSASIDDPDNSVLALMLDSSEVVKEAKDKKALLLLRIQQEKNGTGDDGALKGYEASAEAMKGRISTAQSKIALVESAKKSQDRKAELEAEQKAVAAKFEGVEREISLVEEFTRVKVKLLEGQINGMFSSVPGLAFKMFKPLINGGLEECCEVTVGGVNFNTGLNTGARATAGLGIVRVLSQKIGLQVPCFIDNCESITRLPEMDCQVVSLVVSKEDKDLRVETL